MIIFIHLHSYVCYGDTPIFYNQCCIYREEAEFRIRIFIYYNKCYHIYIHVTLQTPYNMTFVQKNYKSNKIYVAFFLYMNLFVSLM